MYLDSYYIAQLLHYPICISWHAQGPQDLNHWSTICVTLGWVYMIFFPSESYKYKITVTLLLTISCTLSRKTCYREFQVFKYSKYCISLFS